MSATDLIINARQAEILGVLVTCESANADKLLQASGMGRSTLSREVSDLRERELVHSQRGGHHRTLVYVATVDGRLALQAYSRQCAPQAAGPDAAKKSTISFFGDPYVPPTTAYYRNNGNVHIASRGLRC